MTSIPGRKKALELEQNLIEEHQKKHGEKPRGNRK